MTTVHEDADVVVLGASFAGIEVVHQLAKSLHQLPLRIAVVDRQVEHGYLPLAHECLSGTLRPEDARLQTRRYIESLPRARFIHNEVIGLDPDRGQVTLAHGVIEARFIVVALGSDTRPPQMTDLGRILGYKDGAAFSTAREIVAASHDTGEPLVVVGGGLSGVELAAELATVRRQRHPRDDVSVCVVCADDELLRSFSKPVRNKAHAILRAQGVSVRLGCRCVRAHAEGLTVEESGVSIEIPAAATLWAGGLVAPTVLGSLHLPRTDDGWLKVGPTLQCFPGAKSARAAIFACGDAVRVFGAKGRWPTMQRAIECIWQAKIVAQNVRRLASAEASGSRSDTPLLPHRCRDTFFYGLSLGQRSLVVYRRRVLDVPGINHAFRRWLMRRYFARYAPIGNVGRGPPAKRGRQTRDAG